jgi:hypothetical protein
MIFGVYLAQIAAVGQCPSLPAGQLWTAPGAPRDCPTLDIHEGGIFMEQVRKRIHIVSTPGVSEAC